MEILKYFAEREFEKEGEEEKGESE
jgi:hypothetical protein